MRDHPKLREQTTCPICGETKDAGCVACWPCWRGAKMDPRFGALLDLAERLLTQGAIMSPAQVAELARE